MALAAASSQRLKALWICVTSEVEVPGETVGWDVRIGHRFCVGYDVLARAILVLQETHETLGSFSRLGAVNQSNLNFNTLWKAQLVFPKAATTHLFHSMVRLGYSVCNAPEAVDSKLYLCHRIYQSELLKSLQVVLWVSQYPFPRSFHENVRSSGRPRNDRAVSVRTRLWDTAWDLHRRSFCLIFELLGRRCWSADVT